MKEKMKKMLALLLCAAALLTFTVCASAADITSDDALRIALADAGLKESEVTVTKCALDYDDGLKEYDIEFLKAETADLYIEYEYEILASGGRIVSKETERKRGAVPGGSSVPQTPSNPAGTQTAADIGADGAKKAALEAFGLSENEVSLLKLEKDRDDGAVYYEIEYRKGFDVKYSCDVNAATGEVKDMETDYSRTPVDRIELFFDAIEFFFRSIFFSVR